MRFTLISHKYNDGDDDHGNNKFLTTLEGIASFSKNFCRLQWFSSLLRYNGFLKDDQQFHRNTFSKLLIPAALCFWVYDNNDKWSK